MLILVLSVLFLLSLMSLAYHLAMAALFWAPSVLLGLLVMQGVLSAGHHDPSALLWAYVTGALLGRFAVGRLRARLLTKAWI